MTTTAPRSNAPRSRAPRSNAPTPIQRSFDLRIDSGSPMAGIETAKFCLRKSEDDILELINEGHLQFAWNIASEKSRAKEIRILAQSIVDYNEAPRNAGFSRQRSAEDPHALDAVIFGLFKHSRPDIRVSDLFRLFNCSSQHILELIREGAFGPIARAQCKNQAGQQRVSPLVPRAAVIQFLKSRRLP